MSAMTVPLALDFPDSDGQPMADNTLQYEWISLVKWNVEAYFRDDPNVFVAGDNLIYPDPTDATVRQAPDVYVAFGRPKGYRGSYKLWEEADIFPQVIFEVWSPNNRADEMEAKRRFYEYWGAEEYYLLHPDHPMHADGWRRENDALVKIDAMNGHVSPRLGMEFELKRGRLKLFGPDRREMKNPEAIARDRDEAERRLEELLAQSKQQEDVVNVERRRAEEQTKRAELLAEQLRKLGVDPDKLK